MERARRLVALDALRVVAAISVMMYHYSFDAHYHENISPLAYPWLDPIFRYGYLGVPLFFMISGFVILMSAEKATPKQFVASRCARLLPAFWVCCTISFFVHRFLANGFWPPSLDKYLASMTLTYKLVDQGPIDAVYWSLLVEIKFYALVWLCICFGQMRRVYGILAGWLLFTIANQFLKSDVIRLVFLTEYAQYFIGGCAMYLIWSRGLNFRRVALTMAALAVALWIEIGNVPGVVAWHNAPISRARVGILVIMFFATLFYLSIRHADMKRSKWLELAGAMSYPVYLLHLNSGVIIFRFLYGKMNVHLLYWGMTGAVVVLAWAVHRFVEKPVQPWMKGKILSLSLSHGLPRANTKSGLDAKG